MLLTSTTITKNKETNHNQGSDHIISIKPILQPVTGHVSEYIYEKNVSHSLDCSKFNLEQLMIDTLTQQYYFCYFQFDL